MRPLQDKIVLITGAAQGIGQQLAGHFAQAGCTLVLVDVKAAALQDAAAGLTGATVHTRVVDVADRIQTDAMVRAVLTEVGCPDIIVNNAGILRQGPMVDLSLDDWHTLIGVNFSGAINITWGFLAAMRARGSGQIVNISSGQFFFRLPTYGAYTATKAAVAFFSETLGYELRSEGIRTTTIYPFAVRTHLYDNIAPARRWGRILLKLMGVFGQSPEQAGRLIFRAIRKGKRVSMGGFLNWIGFALQTLPPVAYLYQRLAAWLLVPLPPGGKPDQG